MEQTHCLLKNLFIGNVQDERLQRVAVNWRSPELLPSVSHDDVREVLGHELHGGHLQMGRLGEEGLVEEFRRIFNGQTLGQTMLGHCNLKQNMCLCSKQSSLFSFYALPSGGKSKDAVVHWIRTAFVVWKEIFLKAIKGRKYFSIILGYLIQRPKNG